MRAILIAAACGIATAATVYLATPADAHTRTTVDGARYCKASATAVQIEACVGATPADYAETDDDEADGAPQAYFRNQWGGLNDCSRAATDTEVEWCAGELPASSPANPARFDCRQAEVDAEFRYCRKPFPHRVPAR
jgi:hypothetical protein